MVSIYIKKDTVELNEGDKRPLWKMKIAYKMHTNRIQNAYKPPSSEKLGTGEKFERTWKDIAPDIGCPN